MGFMPIYMEMGGRRAVVVGGGEVALRKCRALVDAGAQVTVVSPVLHPELAALRDRGMISHCERGYIAGDLAGAVLAFAATDDHAANQAVARDAACGGIPVSVADAPERGTFITPSRIRRGALLITISTGGRSPALAGRIRGQLEQQFGPEYAPAVELLGRIREKLLTEKGDRAYNKQLLNYLAGRDIPRMFRNERTKELNDLLQEILGPDYTLSGLMTGTKDPA